MAEDSEYQKSILNGLGFKAAQGHPIYRGTVTAKVKANRRAKNKMARVSRRNNRG